MKRTQGRDGLADRTGLKERVSIDRTAADLSTTISLGPLDRAVADNSNTDPSTCNSAIRLDRVVPDFWPPLTMRKAMKGQRTPAKVTLDAYAPEEQALPP
jgi:hypothetical protein